MKFLDERKKFFIFLFFGVLLVFIYSFKIPLDPDFGWHFKYGEYILKNHALPPLDYLIIPGADSQFFSTQWLSDVLSYLIYEKLSVLGLMIVDFVVMAIAFLVPFLFSKKKYFYKFLVLYLVIFLSGLVLVVGFRPQIFTILGFSLVLTILNQRDPKLWRFLPLIFLLWTNLHGGWPIGIFLMAIFLMLEPSFKFLIIFLLSSIASLLSPTSFFIIQGLLPLFKTTVTPSFFSTTDPLLTTRKGISEWLPVAFSNPNGIAFVLIILLSFTMIIVSRKKIKLPIIITFFSFLYLATLSRRHVSLFSLSIIPLFLEAEIKIKSPKKQQKLFHYTKMIAVPLFALLLSYVLIISTARNFKLLESVKSERAYFEAINAPIKALDYVKEKKLKGQMFNFYNWGGFLIWQAPEYQTFMDGRIPGSKIFFEYSQVINLEDGWEKVLDKYKVEWLLVPTFSKWEETVVKTGKWQRIYKDDTAMTLIRKGGSNDK